MWLKWNRHDLSAYIVVIEREGDGEGEVEVEGDTHTERDYKTLLWQQQKTTNR